MMLGGPRRRHAVLAVRYGVLSIASVVSLGPLIYMLLTSLKKDAFTLTTPVDVIGGAKSLSNYGEAWGAGHLSQYFLNSLSVALVTTVFVVLLGSMMAYALARFDFPGKGLFFSLIIIGLMIPAIMLIIPQFILARDLGLLDTRTGLVLFYIGTNLAFNTFLLRGFFEGIPGELDEAMRIDGASAWRRYWQLIMPLAKPALATSAIFSFLGAWDEYVWAVTIISDPAKRTLPVGIALFSGTHATDWGLTFAASAIAMLPVLIVFLIFQRQLISGITSGALKS